MTFAIRPCRPGDAEALATVASATFLETYTGIVDGRDIIYHCQKTHSVEAYERLLVDPTRQLFIAEYEPGAAPVGYIMVSLPDLPIETAATDLELTRIYTLHRFHGQGLGPDLLDTALDHARKAGAGRLLLAVYSRNERALSFYRRSGFEQVGTRVFHVGDNGYDDYVLAKDLSA